jgi:putative serine protease PepD
MSPPGAFGESAPFLTEAASIPRRRAERRGRGRGTAILLGAQLVVILVLAGAVVALAVRAGHVSDDLAAVRTQDKQLEDRVASAESDAGTNQSDLSDIKDTLNKTAAQDPAAIAAEVQPSVFTIVAGNAQGSSWVVAVGGQQSHLVTNFHVVADLVSAGQTNVTLIGADGNRFPGVIEKTAQANDLALISVDRKLQVLDTSTDVPKAGSPVVVIGAPLGLGNTVTTGSVSNQGRTLDDGLTYIQFSAPISPGNSGGPVVNNLGKVVGVATAKVVTQGAEGIGFALPVRNVCDQFKVCK